MITRTSKYEIVGQRTAKLSGKLVDVGARDRVLQQYLRSDQLKYLSADIVPGHDLCWNLEKPLDYPDNTFEVVVALDVLEHVEYIHCALGELLRVAKLKLFISLPNMTCLSLRWHFVWHGWLSGKYALLPDYQGDRHRWLISYPQACALVKHVAQSARCVVQQYDIVAGYDRTQALISRLPFPPELRTYTMLFEIIKPNQ